MATPKMIFVNTHEYLDLDETSLEEAKTQIEGLMEKYPDAEIREVTDHDGYTTLSVFSRRMETQLEAEIRESIESQEQDRQKEYRRKKYEELRKEFG